MRKEKKEKDNRKDVIFNQDLPKIVYENKRVDATGHVIDSEYLSVQGVDLKEVRKHFNELKRDKKR